MGWGLGDLWRVHEGGGVVDDSGCCVWGRILLIGTTLTRMCGGGGGGGGGGGVCRNRNVVERHQMCAKLNEQLREYKRAHGCVVPVCAPFVSCLTLISLQRHQLPLVMCCVFVYVDCLVDHEPWFARVAAVVGLAHGVSPFGRFDVQTDDDTASLSSWASESSYNTTPSLHALNTPLAGLVETAESAARRYSAFTACNPLARSLGCSSVSRSLLPLCTW